MIAGPDTRLLPVSELIGLSADLATVRTDTPLPPGTRVRFEVELPDGGRPFTLVGKIVGLERRASATYDVRVRLHSLPRGARAALVELLATGEH
jgi:hypothetical protein